MSGSMRYRLRVADPATPHMVQFRNAMRTIQSLNDNRGYHQIAGFHGAPGRYCWHNQFSPRTPLTARVFLPWHRAYLYHLEQALQDVSEDVSLPWWDWTQGAGIPAAYAADVVDGQPNPLRRSSIDLTPPQVGMAIQRDTLRNPDATLPVFSAPFADRNQDGVATLSELSAVLVEQVSDFETFNDLIETVHDSIHGFVGGDMASVATAAYDPIFFAHHAMIDRLWYLWQLEHGVDNFPEALKSMTLAPFNTTIEEVLNVQELGYEYAVQAIAVDGGAN